MAKPKAERDYLASSMVYHGWGTDSRRRWRVEETRTRRGGALRKGEGLSVGYAKVADLKIGHYI
jgi:hypothetical protein